MASDKERNYELAARFERLREQNQIGQDIPNPYLDTEIHTAPIAEDEASDATNTGVSRRWLLGLFGTTGLIVASGGAGYMAAKLNQEFAQGDRDQLDTSNHSMEALNPHLEPNSFATEVKLSATTQEKLRVDSIEKQLRIPDLPGWYPDTATSVMQGPTGGMDMYVVAARETYRFNSQSRQSALVVAPPDRDVVSREPEYVYGKGYLRYTGMSSVFNHGDSLYGLAHHEYWVNDRGDMRSGYNYRAAINLYRSDDGGVTWADRGTVIDGQHAPSADRLTSGPAGAGQPTAFLVGDRVRVCYTDWSLGQKGPDSLHLAECPFDQLETAEAWKKWDGTGFTSPGNGGESQPIISPAQLDGAPVYTALAQVTFNTSLNKYLMIFEENQGFRVATSETGTEWSQPQLVCRFPQPQAERQPGQEWWSYPSLLSATTSNQTTQGSMSLVYSKGFVGGSHQMWYRNVNVV